MSSVLIYGTKCRSKGYITGPKLLLSQPTGEIPPSVLAFYVTID